MDDLTFAFWLEYVQEVADLMDLRDWDVRIDRWDRPDEGARADVFVWPGQRRATLRLDPDVFLRVDAPALEDQRLIVCHELVHLYAEGIKKVLAVRFDGKCDDRDQLFVDYMELAIEEFVDAIAGVLVKYAPLPERLQP